MQLPESFISTIKNVFKKDGEDFLAVLPSLIDEACQRWGLSDVHAVPNLSFHFVAFAKRDGQDVILKMGSPNSELTSEMTALKLFNGNGACRLLEHDEERGLLLLERLKPGKMLSELEDDGERTNIAADVILNMASNRSDIPAPLLKKFIQLSYWFDGLKKIRPHFNGGTGPFPQNLLERVESFLPELFADQNTGLMHGDFHHFNILSSERGWLIIDPKGVIGPLGYEIGPLMINPGNRISDRGSFKVQAERRVSILSERLGWEREKIIRWSLAHAVLSAWWSIEDSMEAEYSLQCAAIFSGLK
jgi:streptomycin 6-kinase